MQEADVQKLLREGIAAAKAAQQKLASQFQAADDTQLSANKEEQRRRARELLWEVVELDSKNVQAWLWLSTVVDDFADKSTCLNNVLTIDPTNKSARAGLAWLERQITAASHRPGATAPAHPPKSNDDKERHFDDYHAEYPGDLTADYTHADAPWSEFTQAQPAQTEQSELNCPFCNRAISNSDTECPHCNLPLVMDCPACGTLMDVEWETCTECGYLLGDHRLGSVYFTHLATGYRDQRQPAKALEAIRVAEKMDPNQPDLYRLMGEIQHEVGHIYDAIATLRRAVQQEPEQVGPYISLGRVLKQEGHWDEAEEIYNQAINIVPESSEAHYAMGDLMLQRGNRRKARKYLQQALKLDSQHGLAWANLGQFYEKTGNHASAIYAYRQAIQLIPQDTLEWEAANIRLHALDPTGTQSQGQGWGGLIVQVTGLTLICLLAALLLVNFDPQRVPITGWVALFPAVLGAFLFVSGASMPQNPAIRFLVGEQGLGLFGTRFFVGFLGAILWLLALGVILLPFIQTITGYL